MGTGYRLPVPTASAFTLGNVILTRRDILPADSALFRHEARHTTQYAWCAGLLMLPLYFAAAGMSWVLCGDFGAWNAFERGAGLSDGGYAAWPLRPVFDRLWITAKGRLGAVPHDGGPGPESAAPGGPTAIVSR